MADAPTTGSLLHPAHPLEARRPALAALSGELGPDLHLALEPDVAALDVRLGGQPSGSADTRRPGTHSVGEPLTAGARALTDVLGAPLPGLGTWARIPDGQVFRLGPDEWLVTSTTADPAAWEAHLIEVLRPHGGTATDVSAQRTGLRVGGDRARDLLAHGCALDLRPRSFPAGACAQTLFGQIAVLLAAHGGDGGDDGGGDGGGAFQVLTRTSFAGYLTDRLLDAADGLTDDHHPDDHRHDPTRESS